MNNPAYELRNSIDHSIDRSFVMCAYNRISIIIGSRGHKEQGAGGEEGGRKTSECYSYLIQ